MIDFSIILLFFLKITSPICRRIMMKNIPTDGLVILLIAPYYIAFVLLSGLPKFGSALNTETDTLLYNI
jgi:hypothetical protein